VVVCESETVGNTGYHHLFAICEPNCPVLVVACHLTTVQHFQNFMQIYRYTSESAISTSGFRAPSGLSGIISGMRRSAFGLPHPLFSRYDDCNCVLLFVNKDPTDSRWDYCNFLPLIANCPTNPALPPLYCSQKMCGKIGTAIWGCTHRASLDRGGVLKSSSCRHSLLL
jgi:hypothetical protein